MSPKEKRNLGHIIARRVSWLVIKAQEREVTNPTGNRGGGFERRELKAWALLIERSRILDDMEGTDMTPKNWRLEKIAELGLHEGIKQEEKTDGVVEDRTDREDHFEAGAGPLPSEEEDQL